MCHSCQFVVYLSEKLQTASDQLLGFCFYVNDVMVGLPFTVAIHLPEKLRGDETAYSPGLVSSQCLLIAAIKDIALFCKINSCCVERITVFIKSRIKLLTQKYS